MIRSHPGIFLLGFVVAGITLANCVSVSPQLLLLGGSVCLGVALWLVFHGRRVVGAVLACVALALMAALNFQMRLTGFGTRHLRQVVTSPATYEVFGQVADWPEFRAGRTETVLEIDSLAWRSQAGWTGCCVEGRLLLKVTDTTTALQRGDRVAFRARLYPVIAAERREFPYARYLNLRGIFAQAFMPTLLNVRVDRRPTVGFVSLVDRLRSGIRSALERNLSPPAAALARGFLIGETRDIPPQIYTLFRDSGTLHLLAVSGSNVALIVLFAMWVMRPFWLGVRPRSLVLLAVLAIFAGLSYAEPSVMRATVMAALIIGARLLGRTYDLNNVIAVAALIILLFDPGQLFDVGFQLSFVTAWGLIFFVPRLAATFGPRHERTWYRWLVLTVLVALVAQVVSAPIVAYYFDRVPVLGVVANLVIVPIVALAVIGILILLAADFIWPLMGSFVGSLVDLWMQGLVAVLRWFGGEGAPIFHPGQIVQSSLAVPMILATYFFLIVLTVALSSVRTRKLALILALLVVNAAALNMIFAGLTRDDAKVAVERVPGGVAAIVWQSSTHEPELIITGLSRQSYSLRERVLQPMLYRNGVTRLSRLVLFGADYDALEHVLQLSVQLGVDTLFAGQNLQASIEDVRRHTVDSIPSIPVLYFGDRSLSVDQEGLFLSENQVTWSWGEARIDVIDRPRFGYLEGITLPRRSTLIIGRQWFSEPDDPARLRQAGYTSIICANIEQPGDSPWPDAELDYDAPPDFVHNLSKVGPVTFDPAP